MELRIHGSTEFNSNVPSVDAFPRKISIAAVHDMQTHSTVVLKVVSTAVLTERIPKNALASESDVARC